MLNGWREVLLCPLCNSSKKADTVPIVANPNMTITVAPEYDLPMQTRVTYDICGDCGMIYQNPRLTDAALSLFYTSGVYRETTGLTDEVSDAGEEGRARKLIQFLDGMKFESVLDIGCSRGYFLSMIDAPYKRGVEVDRRRPFVFDEKLIYDRIPDESSNNNSHFDLVTLVHYLEHDTDPLQLVRSLDCHYLYIEVPSEHSAGGPARLAHLTVWSLPTLLYLAEVIHAKVIKYRENPHHSILLEKER
jgi:hypothetical protein